MAIPRGYNKFIKAIAANVKNARIDVELTQEGLSAKSGIDYRHLQRIESGKHGPSLMTLYRLARVLNVPLEKLVRDRGQ